MTHMTLDPSPPGPLQPGFCSSTSVGPRSNRPSCPWKRSRQPPVAVGQPCVGHHQCYIYININILPILYIDIVCCCHEVQGAESQFTRKVPWTMAAKWWIPRFINGLYTVYIRCVYIYGWYMVYIWLLYGFYMVHIWFLYGSYMVHIWFTYGLCMVYIWFTGGFRKYINIYTLYTLMMYIYIYNVSLMSLCTHSICLYG